MNGLDLIDDERRKQVCQHEFDSKHDAKWRKGELSLGAVAYILFNFPALCHLAQFVWPWDLSWFKPDRKSTVRNLVKAGALIAAAIDRLQPKEVPPIPDGEAQTFFVFAFCDPDTDFIRHIASGTEEEMESYIGGPLYGSDGTELQHWLHGHTFRAWQKSIKKINGPYYTRAEAEKKRDFQISRYSDDLLKNF